MRPIDADAIPKEFLEYEFDGKWNGCTIKDLIDEQPTIQPQSTTGQLNDGARSIDLIDRQQVIDALKRFKPEIIPYEKARRYVEETVETMYDRIVELPTIQPELAEGHWINGKCDRCGEHAPFWAMASTYHESNYCPHCGQKMKGVSNE